ncbi:hypothetical protein BDR05DRAFT_303336 [Suillus weaverae]|nr:hypothetical protein BDR05DRAFT_303336 [Suillus weaverae]
MVDSEGLNYSRTNMQCPFRLFNDPSCKLDVQCGGTAIMRAFQMGRRKTLGPNVMLFLETSASTSKLYHLHFTMVSIMMMMLLSAWHAFHM